MRCPNCGKSVCCGEECSCGWVVRDGEQGYLNHEIKFKWEKTMIGDIFVSYPEGIPIGQPEKDMNDNCEHTHKDAPHGSVCEDCADIIMVGGVPLSCGNQDCILEQMKGGKNGK